MDNIELLFEKAKRAYESGRLTQAIDLFNEILDLDADNEEALSAKIRASELLSEPNIMILRQKRFPGCGSKIPFFINDELKHKFKNGEFLRFRIPIGKYRFNFAHEERCSYFVEIKNDYHIIEINCYNSLNGVQMEANERQMVHRYKDIF